MTAALETNEEFLENNVKISIEYSKEEGDFYTNLTDFCDLNKSLTNPNLIDPNFQPVFIITNIIRPILCIIGFAGNLLNVIVLSRYKCKTTCLAMEQSAYISLLGLIISDILFCIVGFIHAFFLQNDPQVSLVFSHEPTRNMYATLYGPFFQNLFTHTGAWLTVIIAVGRYLAVCKPIEARYKIGVGHTRAAVVLTFFFWILLEIPNLWTYHIKKENCIDGSSIYFMDQGYFVTIRYFKTTFTYIYVILGFFIPSVILAYCNFHLVKSLTESYKLRRDCSNTGRMNDKLNTRTSSSNGLRLTVTFVALVFFFLIMNSPAELVQFFYFQSSKNQIVDITMIYEIFNLIQTSNFALNFLLYSVVNARFRDMCKAVFCSCFKCKETRNSNSHSSVILGNLSNSLNYTQTSKRASNFNTLSTSIAVKK